MATSRTPFWTLVFAVFALDLGIMAYGWTLNLTAVTPLPAEEGNTLSFSCSANRSLLQGYLSFESSAYGTYSTQCIVLFRDHCSTNYRPGCYCYSNSSSEIQTFQMNIHPVKTSEAVDWRCSAYRSDWSWIKESSTSLSVIVNGRPTRPTLSPIPTAVRQEGDITLTCSTQATTMPVSNRSSLEYTWRREGSLVGGENRSTLVLQNVQKGSEGRYTCVAKESGKSLSSEASNQVYVDVQYAPTSVILVPPTPSYEVMETTGAVPNIQCLADCDPPCSFQWTDKGGNPVGGTGRDLLLTYLRREQSGEFTCSAFNHHGLSTARVYIKAAYPPEVTLTQTKVTLMEGDNVTVQCHVDASPPAVLSWTRQSAPGNVTFLPQPSPWLELRGVGEGDTGLYTCSASNRLSSQVFTSQASVSIQVTRRQQEAAPSVENPVLSWKAGIGVGLVVGCVVTALGTALLCFLLMRRMPQPKEVQREESTENSYEDLDLRTRRNERDNTNYQQFQLYENQGFVMTEGIRGSQAAAARQPEPHSGGSKQTEPKP